VLDEADEMLDMGFQEDLEFILSAAPEGRRTLMFSATVPKEIENLAGQYQTNALRIVAAGESKQHGDISYRGYSVAVRDREHAIFNLLRYHEARMALVFCKTRANVNHLLARMGNRGFQAVALSGELSQTERMHALQALRDGRARVCIATDVAARGIDLPGLELVIHADLPSNPETLLHRSGRTGRAGSKGISALIVTPAEFRKASRILQTAKITAEWGSPPSADEVQARDDARLLEHPALAESPGDEADLAAAILERFGPERAAAAFVRLWREGRSAPEVLSDALPPPSATPSAPRSREAFGDAVWFVLNVGHTGRAEARWLLPKVCDAGGVTKDAIGAIRVQQDETYIQIATASAARFAEGMELEPGLTITRIAGEPAAASRPPSARPAAPRRAAPRDAEERPAYRPKPPRIVEEGEAAAAPAAAAPEAPARKPYAPRDAAERKPYAPREAAERKPYAPREGAERKPYAAREGAERKPYAPREGAERKPYAPRAAAEGAPAKKPRWSPEDRASTGRAPRAEGFKSHSDRTERPASDRGERPAWPKTGKPAGDARPRGPKPAGTGPAKPRSAGFKSHGGPAGKPGKSTGFKSHAGAGKTPARPAKPPANPSDTSRRFSPPKKPAR